MEGKGDIHDHRPPTLTRFLRLLLPDYLSLLCWTLGNTDSLSVKAVAPA